MLRIHFTPDDLARTRLAPAPDPLWETVLSLHVLRTNRAELFHGDWRRSISAELRSRSMPPGLRMLFDLNPLDPATLGGAVLVLIAAAAAAAYPPMRRATRLDPAITLRSE